MTKLIELENAYADYRKDNIRKLKEYKKKYPYRRIKWVRLSFDQFKEKYNKSKTFYLED